MSILYSIEDYDRPSVATDAVVFGVDSLDAKDRKSLKEKKLKLLLVKRGEAPFEGQYSLPGGFLRRGETVHQSAVRELEEESGVKDPKLIELGVYSDDGRDPRGWIISCCFIALSDTVQLSTARDSDARSAHWLDIESISEDGHFSLKLTDNGGTVFEYTDGEFIKNELAFDHGKMVRDAFFKLRDEVVNHDMIFDLMPELFTISDLQRPYEIITGVKLSPQGFRKRMMGKVEETDKFDEAAAHRTSKLYRRAGK